MADRILAPLGQDALEHFCSDPPPYYNINQQPLSRFLERLEVKFLIAAVITVAQSFVFLLQIASTHNESLVSARFLIAFNSFNRALFGLVVSNNFVEIKQAIFKRFNEQAHQRVTLSDARERFQFSLILLIIAIRNLSQYECKYQYLEQIFPYIILMLATEVFVDYVKHVSMIRFNNLKTEFYSELLDKIKLDLHSSYTGNTNRIESN
ncbi:hypothetical protein ACOME3_008423 [Neoechinorhynchus agilis]